MSMLFRFFLMVLILVPANAWASSVFFVTQIRNHYSISEHVDQEAIYIRLDPIRDGDQLWVQGTFWTQIEAETQPQKHPSRYFTAIFPVSEILNIQLDRFTWNIHGLGTLRVGPAQPDTLTFNFNDSVLESFYFRSVYGAYDGVNYPVRAIESNKLDIDRFDRWPLSSEYGPWTAAHPDQAFQQVNFYFLKPRYRYPSKGLPHVLVQEIDWQGHAKEKTVPWIKEETLDGQLFHLEGYGTIRMITPMEIVWDHADSRTTIFPLERRLVHFASTQLQCNQALDRKKKHQKQTDEWIHYYTFKDGSTWTSQRLYEYALKPYWRDMRDHPEDWLALKSQWRLNDLYLKKIGFHTHAQQKIQINQTGNGILDSIKSVHQTKHIEMNRQRFLTFAMTSPESCQTFYQERHKNRALSLPTTALRFKLPIRYSWTNRENAPVTIPATPHTFH